MDCDIDATQVLDLGLDVPQTEPEDAKREVLFMKICLYGSHSYCFGGMKNPRQAVKNTI